MRRLALVVLSALPWACNSLVGAPSPRDEPSLEDGGGLDDASLLVDAASATDASDASSPPPDPPPDPPESGAPDDAADSPDSAPDSACGIHCAPTLLATGLGRTVNVWADPGATGSVFFGDFDSGQVYRFDKVTSHLLPAYPSGIGDAPYSIGSIVANGTNVYWTVPLTEALGWVPRAAMDTQIVRGTSFGTTWNGPWGAAIDSANLYWCNRWGFDCWSLDLTLFSAKQIYSEKLGDGGAGSEELYGGVAADPGAGGYLFFTALNSLNRMNKDGTGMVPFARVVGQSIPAIDAGYVYWVDPSGAILRAPEDVVPACDDAGLCGQRVAPAGTANGSGPAAFDDTFVYWIGGPITMTSTILRVRKDGTSTAPETLVQHSSLSGIAVDTTSIYYATQNDDGANLTGSFWRLGK